MPELLGKCAARRQRPRLHWPEALRSSTSKIRRTARWGERRMPRSRRLSSSLPTAARLRPPWEELVERFPPFAGPGLAYLKWGLAGCGRLAHWPKQLAEAITRLPEANPLGQAVAVAYADWQRADAPRPDAVCDFACTHACGALLLDTWGKDGTTLLDWLTLAQINRLTQTCRAARVRIALAGSLGAGQVRLLHDSQPDWFAVRGAVCTGGRREQAIDPGRGAQLGRSHKTRHCLSGEYHHRLAV